jgi:hypothetical protein
MTRVAVLVAPVLLLGLLVGPQRVAAGAPDTLDQSQALATLALPDPANDTSNQRTWWAQTFTAGMGGPLDRIQLVCTGTPNASITVNLTQTNAGGYPLQGADYLLAQATAPCANPGQFNDFVFNSPATLTKGTKYGLTMAYSKDYSFAGAINDVYALGSAYCINIWYAWNALASFDLAFRTYVQDEAPTASPSPVVDATPTASPSPAGTAQPATAAPAPTSRPTLPPTSTVSRDDPGWGATWPLLLIIAIGGLILAVVPRPVSRR